MVIHFSFNCFISIAFEFLTFHVFENSFSFTFEAESKLGISFRAHPTMVNLFLLANIDMGYHYKTSYSAAKIMGSISEDMHSAFMNHIKGNDDK